MILAIEWYHYILATLFASVCVLLMLVILLQRGRGVGLTGAFGGVGGTAALGAKTGDVLTWVTMILAAVFVLLAVGMNYVFVEITPTAPPARTSPAPPGAEIPADEVPPPAAPGGPAAPPADAAEAPEFGSAVRWDAWDGVGTARSAARIRADVDGALRGVARG